jgi:hypothetical protein
MAEDTKYWDTVVKLSLRIRLLLTNGKKLCLNGFVDSGVPLTDRRTKIRTTY